MPLGAGMLPADLISDVLTPNQFGLKLKMGRANPPPVSPPPTPSVESRSNRSSSLSEARMEKMGQLIQTNPHSHNTQSTLQSTGPPPPPPPPKRRTTNHSPKPNILKPNTPTPNPKPPKQREVPLNPLPNTKPNMFHCSTLPTPKP